jgi:hypothetical protein
MILSVFERLLLVERYRQRSGAVGYSTPALLEWSAEKLKPPFVASNMRGSFLPTRASSEGFVRFGFSHIPLGQDGPLVRELHKSISSLSVTGEWGNRCTSVQDALDRQRALGLESKTIVVPTSMLSVVAPGTDVAVAQEQMARSGYAAKVDDRQILLGDLPDGAALVAAAPSALGFYLRVGEHLGILLQQVDRALMVVG